MGQRWGNKSTPVVPVGKAALRIFQIFQIAAPKQSVRGKELSFGRLKRSCCVSTKRAAEILLIDLIAPWTVCRSAGQKSGNGKWSILKCLLFILIFEDAEWCQKVAWKALPPHCACFNLNKINPRGSLLLLPSSLRPEELFGVPGLGFLGLLKVQTPNTFLVHPKLQLLPKPPGPTWPPGAAGKFNSKLKSQIQFLSFSWASKILTQGSLGEALLLFPGRKNNKSCSGASGGAGWGCCSCTPKAELSKAAPRVSLPELECGSGLNPALKPRALCTFYSVYLMHGLGSSIPHSCLPTSAHSAAASELWFVLMQLILRMISSD